MMAADAAGQADGVLVVDDSESHRHVIATWLRRAGYRVTESPTGRDALEAADSGNYALVLLDVNLPDMTGGAVCAELKRRPRSAAVPVLHLTATAVDGKSAAAGLRNGAEGYLTEPIDRELLLANAEAAIRTYRSRVMVESHAERLMRLADYTLALHRAEHLSTIISVAATGAAVVTGRASVVMLRTDEHAGMATAEPEGEAVMRRLEVDPSWPSVAPGVHVIVGDGLFPGLAPGARYLVATVHTRGAETAGMLAVEHDRDDVRTEQAVLRQLAGAAGVALDNQRALQSERTIALTLQRSLLQTEVPGPAGLEIAVRYAASAELAEVGGDFFETISVDDRITGLTIGDVEGHSIEAAAVMAELRSAIRAYALEGHDPASVLGRVDRLLRRSHPGVTATALFCTYDHGSGALRIANAGHPRPLLLHAGEVVEVPVAGLLLGVQDAARNVDERSAAAGDLLVLVSDGLLDDRHFDPDVTLDRLRSVVAAHGAEPVEEIADAILAEAGPGPAAEDDIALLVVRFASG